MIGANFVWGAILCLSSFSDCARTDLFLGRLRAPPDGFNNPPDTRGRPGERFFLSDGGRASLRPDLRSEPAWRMRAIVQAQDGNGWIEQSRQACADPDAN